MLIIVKAIWNLFIVYIYLDTVLPQCVSRKGNPSFFFRNGVYPQPLHQAMHTASFIRIKTVLQPASSKLITIHGSLKVSTKISHLKKCNMKRLCINMSNDDQHANRTGCKNPVLPLPVGCTQYP
jgi:hypothetical protein